MKCVKCDNEIPTVKFCPACGANQEETIFLTPETNNSKQEKNNNKKNNLMFYIIVSIIGIVAIGIFTYIILQYLNPTISVKGMKKEYTYSEIITKKFKAEGNLFINETNTDWSINGYKFDKGKSTENIPVIIGQNTLIVTNNGASNTYYFNVTNDTNILGEGNFIIATDYLDFDQDGINNGLENEFGTSSYSNDSDGDGLYDNVEIIMLLDPIRHNTYEEPREYKVIQDNDKSSKNYVLVKAKGNVANTYLDKVDLNIGFSSSFIQSDPVKISTTNPETPESMIIYFSKEKNWNANDYSIYTFDEETGSLKELKTKVNGNYFVTTITEFDKIYFIGKKANVPKKYLNQIIILIDNSGSMFAKEYVTNNKKASDSSYYHDVEFKRLSLMTSLVDKLGTENYEYSVYAFTANYCDVIKYSKDSLAIKKGINSLKTDCQKFNGTDMSGSIKKFANTFKDDVYGAKYMIVLTDGVDTGNNEFNLSEYYLNNYRKQGIHIITLGLSSDVNSNYLMDIAYLTKGKYLFASDANMLDTLSEIIESSINRNNATIKIDDKDYTLVADSGFQVERDSFSFKNFISEDSPYSNSYGFSYLAKQIYLNKIFNEDGKSDIVKNKLTDINKDRLIKGNVYNIELSDTYANEIYKNNTPINLTDKNNQDDDYQLLQIINQAFKVQSKKFITKINDFVLKHFQGQFYDYDTDLNKLIDELQSGSPAMLTLSSSAGSHSVLATKIYKAVDTDEYVIAVYDSNIPGREGKIYLKRTTAYYEYANSSYYSVNYNEYDIEFTNMLYLGQY